jgi:hypothetical protein
MDAFHFKEYPKKKEDVAGRKEVKEEEAERRKRKLKHRHDILVFLAAFIS